MRLPLTPPQQLSPAQLPLYTSMQSTISSSFNNFISSTPNGALLGPWGVWIQQPVIGAQVWELVKSMTVSAKLPQRVRQIVILCVGARYKAQYEIYAHGSMARADGMEEGAITTLAAGGRPVSLNEQEGCAFDVATVLTRGGVLPLGVYKHALGVFGQDGVSELINLVGLYSLVSVTLNGFNVTVPIEDEA